MIAAKHVVTAAGLMICLTVGVQAQQAKPALKIGTRVGVPEKSGYDDGGRRDPFASLIADRPAATTAATELAEGRAKGLAGVAIVDVAVKGIITSGPKWIAIVAGPDGTQYLAHTNDRLHDGVIRRIDRDSVLFLARVPDGTGRIVSREVRKGFRPGVEEGR